MRILFAEDDKEQADIICKHLEGLGHDVQWAKTGEDALTHASQGKFDVLIADIYMSKTGMSGFELVSRIRAIFRDDVYIFILTISKNKDDFKNAIRAGTDDFLIKHVPPDMWMAKLWQADKILSERREKHELELKLDACSPSDDSNDALNEIAFPDSHSAFKRVVGRSGAMCRVRKQIRQIAKLKVHVLIYGDTGTGKTGVAEAIHILSGRPRELGYANCNLFSDELAQSQLFGHLKGAFTGATSDRNGFFQNYDKGTLFLDEIGDLSLENQGKLLHAVQLRQFVQRMLETKIQEIDVRVVTATNRNLAAMVDEGTFRKDLLRRIKQFHIQLPPLCERREDVPDLVESFIEAQTTFPAKRKMGLSCIEDDVLKYLQYHHEYREGNVAELENIVQLAWQFSPENSKIRMRDLQLQRPSEPMPDTFEEKVHALEKQLLIDAGAKCNWKVEGKGGMVEVLGLGQNTVREKMKKYKIGPVRDK